MAKACSTSENTQVFELLNRYTSHVDSQMASVVEQQVADPWLRGVIAYHLGWQDEPFGAASASGTPAGTGRSGGKRLRATLTVLAYRAAGVAATLPGPSRPTPGQGTNGHGDRVDLDGDGVGPVLPLAAAVELMHNWSLVHDDIEDGDRTRRGRPALWTVCGEAQAINAGDCIYGLALCSLAELQARGYGRDLVGELMTELAACGVRLTVGQMRDMAWERAVDVDRPRYLEMVAGKTGALTSCATYGGALAATGDRAVAAAFGEYGRQLGICFQIRDDILGIWGNDAVTGKPTGSDLRRRKKTLPVVLAIEGALGDEVSRLVHPLYCREAPLTSADVGRIREVLDQSGAQDLAQDQAHRHRDAALAALGAAAEALGREPTEPHLAAMRTLTDFVTERSY